MSSAYFFMQMKLSKNVHITHACNEIYMFICSFQKSKAKVIFVMCTQYMDISIIYDT